MKSIFVSLVWLVFSTTIISASTLPMLSITCPPDITVSTDIDGCVATNPNISGATSDGGPTAIITNDAPLEFPLGATTVTWTVTEGTETETCTQIITVEDNVAPQIPSREVWEDLNTVPNVTDLLDNTAYGVVMEVDGDYAVVGAIQHGGDGSGAAYILERDASNDWTEVQEITGSAITQNSRYGSSVDIKGDLAIVGGEVHITDQYGEGIAYIWERNASGTWIEVAELLASDRANRDYFGDAVAIDGDFALVGAFGEDDFGSASGAVYAFERDANGDWSETQKFCSDECEAGDFFGRGIIMKGDTAIISATKTDEVVQNEGALYVFLRDNNGVWSQDQKITYSNTQPDGQIGPKMKLHGNNLLVQYHRYNSDVPGVGAAILFKKNVAGIYEEDQLITAPDSKPYDFVSSGIEISQDYIVLGASQENSAHYNSGAVYVYEKDEAGTWTFTDKLTPTSTSHHLFGAEVNLTDDDQLLVGAPSFGSSAAAENAVYYINSSNAVTLVDQSVDCGESVLSPVLDDNCAGSITGTTTVGLPTDMIDLYNVTWDFDDGNGNQVSYDQLINVFDSQSPVLTCEDVTVAVDPDGAFQLSDADLGITYSDACGDVIVLTQPNIWINCFDVGIQNYIIQVEDEVGNRSDCVGTVTVLNASDTVDNLNDAGAGSLRALVNEGCAGDTIYFDSSLAGGTITLDSEIDITTSTVIVGLGENDLTLDGINRYRAFHITNDNLDVHISGMRLINGNDEFEGGAILNEGNLFLSDMILINNNELDTPKAWTNLKDIDITSGTVDIRE